MQTPYANMLAKEQLRKLLVILDVCGACGM